MVQERLVWILQVLLEFLLADPGREGIAVVRRHADHCQDLAGLGIHHDHDAALEVSGLHRPRHRLECQLLFMRVDGERQRIPGDGLLVRLQNLELAARRVALDGFDSVGAAQLLLVHGFDSRFAEQIVGLVALILQLGQACCVDRSRVAQDLGQQRSVEIASLRFDVHLDAGQREGFLGDDVCDVPGYVLRDSDEIEA